MNMLKLEKTAKEMSIAHKRRKATRSHDYLLKVLAAGMPPSQRRPRTDPDPNRDPHRADSPSATRPALRPQGSGGGAVRFGAQQCRRSAAVAPLPSTASPSHLAENDHAAAARSGSDLPA